MSGIRLYIDQGASSAKLAIHIVPGNDSTHGYIASRDTAAAGMSSNIVAARPGKRDVGAAGVCPRLDQGRGGLRDADAAGISAGVDAAGYFQGLDAAGIGTSVGCAASSRMRLSTSPRVNQLSPALRIP